MKTAHYFSGKRNGIKVHTVIIADGPSIVGGIEYNVADKAEARRLAKLNNAKCWNF